MSEQAGIRYYDFENGLIDEGVVDATLKLWVEGTVIFYAQRKHFVDTLKELQISVLLFLSFLSLAVWLQPWQWGDGDILLPTVLTILACCLPFGYFLFEVFRWRRDFLVLTNYGLHHRYFDFLAADWRNDRIDWAPKSDVHRPISYVICNLDVGSLILATIDGTYRTPYVRSPHRLHGLIPVADRFTFSSEDQDEWRLD